MHLHLDCSALLSLPHTPPPPSVHPPFHLTSITVSVDNIDKASTHARQSQTRAQLPRTHLTGPSICCPTRRRDFLVPAAFFAALQHLHQHPHLGSAPSHSPARLAASLPTHSSHTSLCVHTPGVLVRRQVPLRATASSGRRYTTKHRRRRLPPNLNSTHHRPLPPPRPSLPPRGFHWR